MNMFSTKELSFAVKTIKEVLNEAKIPVGDIYLFGSRARGNYTGNSDWDFLVSCKIEIPFIQKAELVGNIQTVLAERDISVDSIIKTDDKIKEEKNNVGVITYYALKDGVPV